MSKNKILRVKIGDYSFEKLRIPIGYLVKKYTENIGEYAWWTSSFFLRPRSYIMRISWMIRLKCPRRGIAAIYRIIWYVMTNKQNVMLCNAVYEGHWSFNLV